MASTFVTKWQHMLVHFIQGIDRKNYFEEIQKLAKPLFLSKFSHK